MAVAVDKDACIGCGACVDVCPVGALEVVEEKAVCNPDTCADCGACVGACPVDALSM